MDRLDAERYVFVISRYYLAIHSNLVFAKILIIMSIRCDRRHFLPKPLPTNLEPISFQSRAPSSLTSMLARVSVQCESSLSGLEVVVLVSSSLMSWTRCVPSEEVMEEVVEVLVSE